MPWLRWLLLFLPVTAVSPRSFPWRRRDAVAAAGAAGAWTPALDAKADVQWAEEVLSAGGNADSPWNKPRSYTAFSLSNGLRVLLVEDDATDQMEMAFTLPFGQFDDLKDLPGLAHLTEHLLLSGPGPSDALQLETWLEPRSGQSNGFTGFESALFTLSCGVEDWSDALRRFGHCFRRTDMADTDSRFRAEAVHREVLRINGEFQDGLSAGLRSLQLLRYRTVEDHPLRSFGPGSLKTLLPRGNGKQELEALARLSQELFSHMLAEQSTLAIVSPLPSSKLRPAVADAFQGLNAVAPPVTWPGRRLAAMADPLPSTGQVPPCFVVQSRENPGISFTWSIPFSATSGIDAASYRASKPLVALAHLVAHQGPGSLSCWLQKQGWLPDNLGPKVTAQAPFSTQSFAIWELKIKLSQQGLQNWSSVATAVFGLLAALRRRRYVRDAQGGPQRDALRQAVDEVSALADIAWRFPPRPPLSSELAVDMRSAPRPAAYVFASRRFFAVREWDKEKVPNALQGRAARFTSTLAQEEATTEVAKVLECLVPDRARLTLWSTVPQPGAQQRRDSNLDLEFGELPLDSSLQRTWLDTPDVAAQWWRAPPLNVYLSKATKITKPAAEADPLIPESIKNKKGFNGVLWSEACRARLVEPKTLKSMPSVRVPPALWVVPGCVYVSGQFNERVEPLGEEPVVTLTLWLPARCITEASVKSRAAGRMWLKSLQVALESPFFGAALAGCRWECAFFTTSPYEAGMRLSFQAFSDSVSSFATDAALAIAQHAGPAPEDLELVRRMALAELKTSRDKAQGEVKRALEQLQGEDIRNESQALWRSVAESLESYSQALVAGAITEDEAAELVRLVLSTLPVPGSDVSDASDASDARPPLELGPRPAAVLTRRPSWQGPVAQSLCRASGLPALLDVCGRAMK